MADMAIETRTATPSRFRNAGLWALQIAGAAMFSWQARRSLPVPKT